MSDAPTDPRRAELASKFLAAVLAGIFLLGFAGFIVAVVSADEEATPRPEPPALPATSAAAAVGSPDAGAAGRILMLAVADVDQSPGNVASAASGAPGGSANPAASADPAMSLDPAASGDPAMSLDPTASLDPAASGAAEDPGALSEPAISARMPVVPAASFWSRKSELSRRDVIAALESGSLRGFKQVIVEDRLRDPLAAALGIELDASVRGGDITAVERAVSRGGLGFLTASHVSPRVRALDVAGRSLFGNERIGRASEWPLLVDLEVPLDEGWDQAQTWVLVAGGDSFTDRGVYDSVVVKGRGIDYPFDGGTARVTGHGCCDPVFNDNVVPRYELTGNRGIVRRLLRSAELAIANHEAPTTEGWAFHRSGLRFSGKPGLTRIFTRAGIDWLSLANNHIRDYGAEGIEDTRRILRKHGISFGGAGRDLEQARRISYLETGETRVAIIPCLDVVPVYWAGPSTSGATPCLDRYLVPDIKRAGRRADVVIVFPHWGTEYTRQPQPSMRKHAARWARAGADLILGAHSHVAGAIEDIDGTPVLYSLGNLIFDQHWSTATMEGMLLEGTFHGDRLVQLRLHPYIIHNQSQPNLLDPATGEGRRLLRQVRAASKGWLDW